MAKLEMSSAKIKRGRELKPERKSNKKSKDDSIAKLVGFKPPHHYKCMPNSDVRYTYTKLFNSFVNSGDMAGFKNFLKSYCTPDVTAVHLYDGEQNPYGPNTRETIGPEAITAVASSIVKSAPDYLVEIFSTVCHFCPKTGQSFISSNYTSSFTKVFEITLQQDTINSNTISDNKSPSEGGSSPVDGPKIKIEPTHHNFAVIAPAQAAHEYDTESLFDHCCDEDHIIKDIALEHLDLIHEEGEGEERFIRLDHNIMSSNSIDEYEGLVANSSSGAEDGGSSCKVHRSLSKDIFSYENMVKFEGGGSCNEEEDQKKQQLGDIKQEPAGGAWDEFNNSSFKGSHSSDIPLKLGVQVPASRVSLATSSGSTTYSSGGNSISTTTTTSPSTTSSSSSSYYESSSVPNIISQSTRIIFGAQPVTKTNRVKISLSGKLNMMLSAEQKITKIIYFFKDDGPPQKPTC